MAVKEGNRISKEQKKLSPREQILQRYGIDKSDGKKHRKARSINELYNLRYQRKIR